MNFRLYVINPIETCQCRTITRYYSCSCFFDPLVKITLPLKEHLCQKKIKEILRKEKPDAPFFFWNDKNSSAAVVCHDCTERFAWRRKYYDDSKTLYYSVTVNNRIKKFDEGGAKRYFLRNCVKLLPAILDGSELRFN